MVSIALIGLYLFAIILANLIVTTYGPSATIWCAFLFIGLDLTLRDKLHLIWNYNLLWIKMGSLIACGALFSYVLNINTGSIAIASCIAFVMAGIADTFVFHYLRNKSYVFRVNCSNGVSALLDSVLFPTIAFGMFLPWIILGQFIAKIIGGFLWVYIFKSIEGLRTNEL